MRTRPQHEPQRTCVGCRATAAKAALVRIVRTPTGEVRVDPTGREPGRGAYVHRDPACVRRAERSNGFARALRAGPEGVRAGSLTDAVRALIGESG